MVGRLKLRPFAGSTRCPYISFQTLRFAFVLGTVLTFVSGFVSSLVSLPRRPDKVAWDRYNGDARVVSVFRSQSSELVTYWPDPEADFDFSKQRQVTVRRSAHPVDPALIPYWSNASGPSPDLSIIYEFAAGFPFLCLTSYIAERWSSDGQLLQVTCWGLPRNQLVYVNLGAYRVIPFRPIILGFIGNILVFTILSCGLITSFSYVRRYKRKKAISCINCGYSLQGISTAQCPECGLGR